MCRFWSRNKIKLKSPKYVTRIKPELQHIMQKFQHDKKPSNLEEVNFKFENSDMNALNSGRTEQKTEG